MTNTPIGWQMISPTRHRARDIFAVNEQIRELYPEARDKSLVKDTSFVYVVPKASIPQRVVALAWREDSGSGWFYVVLPRASLEIGIPCSVFKIDGNRVRVFPGVHRNPPPIEPTARRRSNGPRPAYAPRPPRVLEKPARRRREKSAEPGAAAVFVHQEGGKWVVTVERDGTETTIGRYDSYGEACQHMREPV